MKSLLIEVINHFRSTFRWSVMVMIFMVMTAFIYFNYRLDFEDGMVDTLPFNYRVPAMFLFHLVPYLLTVLIIAPFIENKSWYKTKGFWLRIFIGFGLLALDRSIQFRELLSSYIDIADWSFLYSFSKRILSLITLVFPLYIISLFFEKSIPGRGYGLIVKRFDVRPYLILLSLAGIGIVIGGFFRDIQDYYPRYLELGGTAFARRHEIPDWLNVLVYELAYGTDFISVEMFFRGFLIYGFVRYFGPYVVFPMIATYCFLHFGKPMTEAISSLFGGYILGVISLKSKTIWGGVLIHVGIAWLMEFIGYLFRTI
ncbi:CPBP family intramembrane glutamic endopeptidase [Fulvivirga sedimenti]|uniref:CPBP family intramembrane metalloprotease n=1 Tax=Fulvivirga sedimenti TaxID=2879465 RepID=A0A9X1KZP4_9BACT|nr:CPBP family intramembrane glutamic endopeptidase [Fulvivirga sedimenti]MCA6079083.1 CPBP family intramembrane metalloprotease [Fulvivirga sedimenti]